MYPCQLHSCSVDGLAVDATYLPIILSSKVHPHFPPRVVYIFVLIDLSQSPNRSSVDHYSCTYYDPIIPRNISQKIFNGVKTGGVRIYQ